MPVDLIIKNGVLIDGLNTPRRAADIAIHEGRVVAIGKVDDSAREQIDAE